VRSGEPARTAAAVADEQPAWAKDPVFLEDLFHKLLAACDAKGVEAVLTLLAVCAPEKAVELYDSLGTALQIVSLINAGHLTIPAL